MKKILTLVLVAALMITSAIPALAANSNIEDPGSANTTTNTNELSMYGWVGPVVKVDPTNPSNPVKTISVSIPTAMVWGAFTPEFSTDTHTAPIRSADHYVTCIDATGSADVSVSVTSFSISPTGPSALPDGASLENFGLAVTTENADKAAINESVVDLGAFLSGDGSNLIFATLKPGGRIKMLVTGDYYDPNDTILTMTAETARTPLYTMVLRLDIA